jgi:hypothetical protein
MWVPELVARDFRKFWTVLGLPICRLFRSAASSTCTIGLSCAMRFTERRPCLSIQLEENVSRWRVTLKSGVHLITV